MPRIDIKKNTKLRLFVTANAGIGKTTFAATAEDDRRSSPCLIVNFGGNPETLISRKKIPFIWQPDSTRELELLLTWLRGGQDPKATAVKTLGLPEGVAFKTIVIDHMAEYQRWQNFASVKAGGMGKDQAGLSKVRKPEWDDWHHILYTTINLVRIISDPYFPLHSIMTCHIKEDLDSEGYVTKYQPMLWGRAMRELPGYVLAHGWLTWNKRLPSKMRDKTGAERVMVFAEMMRHILLKSQYTGKLPDLVFDPTVPKLLDLIGAT